MAVHRSARVAALFHLAKHPAEPGGVVSEATMVEAIVAAEWFLAHARCALTRMGADPAIRGAQRVLGWIERNEHREFSRHDARRGMGDNNKGLDKWLGELEGRGFIDQLSQPEQSGKRGPKHSTRWKSWPGIWR